MAAITANHIDEGPERQRAVGRGEARGVVSLAVGRLSSGEARSIKRRKPDLCVGTGGGLFDWLRGDLAGRRWRPRTSRCPMQLESTTETAQMLTTRALLMSEEDRTPSSLCEVAA